MYSTPAQITTPLDLGHNYSNFTMFADVVFISSLESNIKYSTTAGDVAHHARL